MTGAPRGVLPVIAIDCESGVPLYRQIHAGTGEGSSRAAFTPANGCPAMRVLAEELGVLRQGAG
jgi:DNA-binding transcriptional regulator YhcF (GntR family)